MAMCSAEGCSNDVWARGMCNKHYGRWHIALKTERLFSGEKQCQKCGETKNKTEFNRHSNTKDGLRPECRVCYAEHLRQHRLTKSKEYNKRHELKRKHGLTLEQFHEIFANQNGRCAICGTDKYPTNWGTLGVDHDHATGKIRELLCHHCNAGLGAFRDNPELMMKAAAYVVKHRKKDQ